MRILLVLLLFIFGCTMGVWAQTSSGLVAYYSFDTCAAVDLTGNNPDGIIGGEPICDCGVSGQSLKFDGLDDFIQFPGSFDSYFANDFTFSFYFRPVNSSSNQDIFSKRFECNSDSAFVVRYQPANRTIAVDLLQDFNDQIKLTAEIDEEHCWQHIVVVRKDRFMYLYINGFLVDEGFASRRLTIVNNGTFSIANSPCLGITDEPFGGYVDEIRLYNRTLSIKEIDELYLRPDHIATNDTIIYKGDSFLANSTKSCASVFSWFPVEGVDAPMAASSILHPEVTTTYTLNFELLGCIATDTLRVTVINPEDVDCDQVFLPKAFTPNGDGLNDRFGISNFFIIEDLMTFEIFNRWGERLFATMDPNDSWDGYFRNQEVNPGIFIYKIKYRCQGEEKASSGSFSLIR